MSARVSDLNEIRTGTGAEEWNVDHPHWCLYIGCVMVGRRRDNNIIIIRRRRRRCVYPRSYRVARPNPVFRYCRRLLDLGTNPSPPLFRVRSLPINAKPGRARGPHECRVFAVDAFLDRIYVNE